MSRRKQVVETYFHGFRRSDHEKILGCLTADVVWDIAPHTHLTGKTAFDAEIENPAFDGSPLLTVSRLVEEDGTIVAIGEGRGRLAAGDPFGFAFCTVFTFDDGNLICRVESYVVPFTQ